MREQLLFILSCPLCSRCILCREVCRVQHKCIDTLNCRAEFPVYRVYSLQSTGCGRYQPSLLALITAYRIILVRLREGYIESNWPQSLHPVLNGPFCYFLHMRNGLDKPFSTQMVKIVN